MGVQQGDEGALEQLVAVERKVCSQTHKATDTNKEIQSVKTVHAVHHSTH
jgi:hypothetical protein